MVVARRRSVRWLAAFVGAALAGVLAASGSAAAGPGDAILPGTFVDAAVVNQAQTGQPAGTVRLVAVRPPQAGVIEVDLLQTDGTAWTIADTLIEQTDLADMGTPMLVPIGQQFAIVVSDSNEAFIGLIGAQPDGLHRGSTRRVPLVAAGVGTADVDGNGSPELVLAGAPVFNQNGICSGTPLLVLDGASLDSGPVKTIADVAIAGATVGRFDRTGGDDLIAYTGNFCGGDQLAQPNEISVIDLAKGRVTATFDPALGNAPTGPGPLVPLVADLDQDGIDEPIVRSGSSIVVLDPAQGWRSEFVYDEATPLTVIDPHGRPRLIVARPASGPTAASVVILGLGRVGPGGELIERGLTAVSTDTGDPRAGPPMAVDLAADPAAPPPAWSGELISPGCTVVAVPAATFTRCPNDPAEWSSRAGPAWLQTALLGVAGTLADKRLIVAAGTGWATLERGLAAPSPAATYPTTTSRWRSGPSNPFTLLLADPRPLVGSGEPPGPIVTVDPDAGSLPAPVLRLTAPGNARVFVRIGPTLQEQPAIADAAASAIDPPIRLSDFMVTPPSDGSGGVQMVAAERGTPDGTVAYPLPEPPGATVMTGWTVTLLGLSELGEPSALRSGRISLDLTGPTLTVDRPFGSLPWPLHTAIRGTTEPGATISRDGGSAVTAGPDGSFSLDAVLAPWPQDVVVRGTDGHGNVTEETVSLVGGLDYRQLPWQALIVVSVLVAALISTLLGPLRLRRRGSGGIASVRLVDPTAPIPGSLRLDRRGRVEEAAEIEDLPRPPRGARG